MTMRINSIILYNENGKHRELSFKEGVNIITGTKNTGKFAIIPIIEYCLGNSKLNIVGSVVRENVAFYAVIYQFSDRQVIIAKPKPLENRATGSRVFYKEEQSIVIPTLTELRNNLDTDDTVVKNKLSHLLGIKPPFSIQDTFFLLFQDKQTIDRNDIIFYQQDKDNIRKNISDILSYFLGIIQSEDIELKDKINILTKQRYEKNAELKRIQERNNFKFTDGQRLLEKAKRLNLIAQDTVAKDFSELQQLFQIVLQKIKSLIQSQPDTLLKGIDEISVKKLDQEIFALKQQRDSLKDDISELELYLSEANKYDSNTQEQINRLKSVHLFSNQSSLFLETDKCPLCFSTLEKKIIPEVQAIQTEIDRLNSHLKQVKREQEDTSEINKRLSVLKIQHKQLGQDIQDRKKEKKRIEDNNSQAQSFYQQALSVNQVLSEIKGAIENSLESSSNDKSNTFLHEEIKSFNEKIEKLKQQQATEKEAKDTDEKGCLKHIDEKMKSFAQQLGLEDEPFGFSIKRLKIYIDRNGKTKQLVNVTGKSEIVGCHLSLCLALHSFFSKKSRPVPRFIVLDQPAQGYIETTDKEKISTMFNMFFEFCKSMNIQIIITEHFNLQNYKELKKALVEHYWTGEQDRALIPNRWFTNT
jgi:translation elongation factor EF-1beta